MKAKQLAERAVVTQVLSEIERVMERKGLLRSDLADLLGVERSRITILFQQQNVGTALMGRIAFALGQDWTLRLKNKKGQR